MYTSDMVPGKVIPIIIIILSSYNGRSERYIISGSLSSIECACPGDHLLIDCSVTGGVATLWRGTAFDCHGVSNSIILRHSQFNLSEPAAVECNDRIMAHSVGVSDTFTSQLSVNVTEELNNKTIECIRDTSGSTDSHELVGATTIMLATADSSSNVIHLAEVRRGQLEFVWFNNSTICPTDYMYAIHSSNCGKCPTTTVNTNSTCHIPHNRQLNQVCQFAVQTQVCGNNYGNASFQKITIPIIVPDPPKFNSLPNYRGWKLINIQTTWMHNITVFNSSDSIDNSPISYTIIYSDTHSTSPCDSIIIPVSSCEMGICSHLFQVTTSACSASMNINVSVFASNILGDGPLSDPVMIATGSPGPSNSNSVAALIPYVIAVICIASLLLLSLCLIFTIIICIRAKKWRVKKAPKSMEQNKVEDTEAVVYEEIDELQQIPKSIHTSKNLAYCHFNELPTNPGPQRQDTLI